MAPTDDSMPLILVMSNNNEEINNIVQHLTEHKYRVESTDDGFEGLELARTLDPGLIITTLSLSKLNGAKMVRLLKFDKKYKDIPILSILEKETPEELERIRQLKIERFITRPVNVKNLVTSIRNLFSESEIGGFIEDALL